jgi:hypothetical protein
VRLARGACLVMMVGQRDGGVLRHGRSGKIKWESEKFQQRWDFEQMEEADGNC